MGKLFIVSGPSGVGKTTLVHAFVSQKGSLYHISQEITYTSRAPRAGEELNMAYHFVSKQAFEEKIKEGFFLEWRAFCDNYYGIPTTTVSEVGFGRSYFLILDQQGARSMSKLHKESILIWIEPQNIAVLKERLYKRNSEDAQQIARRIEKAEWDIQEENNHPFYTYHILNDTLDKALQELESIVKKELMV